MESSKSWLQRQAHITICSGDACPMHALGTPLYLQCLKTHFHLSRFSFPEIEIERLFKFWFQFVESLKFKDQNICLKAMENKE